MAFDEVVQSILWVLFTFVSKLLMVIFVHLSDCSALPVIQEMNTAVIPTPVISATTSTGVSQQLHGGSSDIAAMGQGLFSNQTEDSDDDYDA